MLTRKQNRRTLAWKGHFTFNTAGVTQAPLPRSPYGSCGSGGNSSNTVVAFSITSATANSAATFMTLPLIECIFMHLFVFSVVRIGSVAVVNGVQHNCKLRQKQIEISPLEFFLTMFLLMNQLLWLFINSWPSKTSLPLKSMHHILLSNIGMWAKSNVEKDQNLKTNLCCHCILIPLISYLPTEYLPLFATSLLKLIIACETCQQNVRQNF